MARRDTTDYLSEARDDAADMADEFIDTIVEMLCDDGEASTDDLNEYPNGDGYHHESHVDKEYDLMEAAKCLDDLDDYEETDEGLWEGLEPRRAVSAQAAYTYGNAVLSLFSDLIDEINGDDDIQALHDEWQAADDEPIPAPTGIDQWTVDQCWEWLDSRGIDPDSIDMADDDVFGWREQVAGASHAQCLPKRSRDQIAADIKTAVETIIRDSR